MKIWLKYILGAIIFFALLSVATLYLGKFDIKIISVGTIIYLVISMLFDFIMEFDGGKNGKRD